MVKQLHRGFTLLELLAVMAIIGILASIAYPSYQNYVIRAKRAEMMAEMQLIGQRIETQKLVNHTYGKVNPRQFNGNYPKGGNGLYTVTVTGIGNPTSDGKWVITATPIANTMTEQDGELVLHANGQKCRKRNCGMSDEWQ